MKETIENNILLAEFLGWKTDTKGRYIAPFGEMDESGYLRYDYEKRNLQFDCDWNWLMLVVDKIESLNLGTKTIETVFDEKDKFYNANVTFKIEYKDCCMDFYGDMKVYKEWVRITQCGSKIEATYNACIQFVKWFNSQNK